MSRLSNYSVGVSSDCRVEELFIDCKSRCLVCKSRCTVCLAVHSVYRLTVGWESYLSTVRVGVSSVQLFIRSIV